MSNFQIIDPYEPTREIATAAPLLRLPTSAVDFDVRPGTLADLPWVDAAQKAEREGLGFRFQSELEGHVREGRLWIAEQTPGSKQTTDCTDDADSGSASAPTSHQSLVTSHHDAKRIGYCVARDRYQSRDELGLIVQMYVVPEHRRSLVAANFLRRIWDTWPTGVKLCSCWCAQDLPANRFWESCGFRALAFRTGSRETRFSVYDAEGNPTGKVKRHRIHIYWQKRIRAGDVETPYWYPGQTGGGSLNEARLVFPIPPGHSWRDAKPKILPGVGDLFEALRREREEVERRALLQLAPPDDAKPKLSKKEKAAAKAVRDAKHAEADAQRSKIHRGGLRFAPLPPSGEELKRQEAEAAAEAKRAKAEATKLAKKEAKAAAKKMSSKNDSALAALSRELRDRWLDAVATDETLLSLPPEDKPAYDVTRQLEAPSSGPSHLQIGEGWKQITNVKRLAA
ncbi:MAG: hypothetical protein AAF328_04495 [Planctomycetota bacterium]